LFIIDFYIYEEECCFLRISQTTYCLSQYQKVKYRNIVIVLNKITWWILFYGSYRYSYSICY